ncbi:MAG: GNAT family N-acetyltransferase [Desulfarculus sp.]|nr:GNAT family N-acetyltransferase [Desulfarculus sp.]
MTTPSLTVRNLARPELDLAVDWAAAEGWNPGLHDADCFWRQDPGGFFGGFLGDEMVASVSVVNYDQAYAFAGFFLVKPGLRGQGYGRAVTAAALAHAGGRAVGLDGVVAQQKNYMASGAVYAHRNRRYQGIGGGSRPTGLVEINQVPWEQVLAHDAACFGAARPQFLRCWLSQPGHLGLAALEGGRLAGFGVLRPCRQGCKIGPLFADTPAQAQAIFQGLLAAAPGQPAFLDTPELNPAALALAEEHGMTMCFETARMYLGHAPSLPLGHVYGITTYELG